MTPDNDDYAELVKILLDSQTKSVEQMTALALNMKILADAQTDIVKRLSNGMKTEIIDGVSEKLKTCSMSNDIKHTKWLVAIIGLCIILIVSFSRAFDYHQAQYQRRTTIMSTEK